MLTFMYLFFHSFKLSVFYMIGIVFTEFSIQLSQNTAIQEICQQYKTRLRVVKGVKWGISPIKGRDDFQLGRKGRLFDWMMN